MCYCNFTFPLYSCHFIFYRIFYFVSSFSVHNLYLILTAHKPGGAGDTPPPPNWVHKKIPSCAVELNTQNCAWFGSQISLITAMSFREAMLPEPPTRGSAPGPPLGDLRSPDPCAPPPLEHSNSRFESIRFDLLCKSIRIDSFCKKIGLSIH